MKNDLKYRWSKPSKPSKSFLENVLILLNEMEWI